MSFAPRDRSDPALAGRRWPDDGSIAASTATARVVAGPHPDRFAGTALDGFLATEWTVRPDSDRMGIRLAGPEVPRPDARELVSLPMTWGAVQVPSDGTPIVLLADHQTVGGYPVLAVVIRADRPVIGQLAPGDAVSFELVDVEAAQAIWREDRARFGRVLEHLAANEHWTDQWRWAGA
jgi:allophanate hydrolase subunit 2